MAELNRINVRNILIGLLIVFGIFFLLSVFMRGNLLKYQNTVSESGMEHFNSNGVPKIRYQLFYADWCPHCQTTKPEWKKMKDNWDMAQREMYWENNKLSYQDVDIQAVNCENDKDSCRSFDIQGYPTIILSIGDNNIEYDKGGRNHSDLMSFLESKLQENKVTYGTA
jgi:thiol-disulfide isomerase/thioredoxin